MNRVYSYLIYFFVLLITAGLFFASQASHNTPTVFAHGGSNDECEDIAGIDSLATGNGSQQTYTAPSGKIVSDICIKSGSGMFGDGHSELLGNGTYNGIDNNPCYTVAGIGTQTVTVTKIGSGSSCKDISHIDVYTADPTPTPTDTQDTPTPTPTDTQDTPTPTDTPNPTPTDVQNTPSPTITPTPTDVLCDPNEEYVNGICIVVDCPGGGDCEVVIGKTPTPTPAATSTPTPTPTNDDGGDDGDDDDDNDDNGGGGSSDGTSSSVGGVSTGPAVLGVSTMAPTGAFSNLFSHTLLISGLAFTALSGGMYVRKK